VPLALSVYDIRCGGAVTIRSSKPEEVVVEPIGYHFTASPNPSTLQLAPGKYGIRFNGVEIGSFAIQACPPVPLPAVTTPPTPAPTVAPAPVDPVLPETR
jgi:hypothetical protein